MGWLFLYASLLKSWLVNLPLWLMSDTSIVIILAVLILHFLVGIGYLLYKIFGKKDSDSSE